MTNFKFTPKLAFAILLVIVFITGVVLLLRTSNNVSQNGAGVNEKGLLSFFGERKSYPLDDTTVAGFGGSNNTDDGTNTGTDSGDGNTDDNNTNGSGAGTLSLKSIGANTSGGANGSGTVSGSSTGGANYTSGNQIDPKYIIDENKQIEQVVQLNCTPKQIEFTEEEQKKLKALEQRFYKVAAEIRTQQDVDTLVQTRQNYYDYLSSDYRTDSRKDGTGIVELTKQCFAEREKVVNAKEPIKIMKATATPDGTVITNGTGAIIIGAGSVGSSDTVDPTVGGVLDGASAWVNQYEWYGRPLGMRLNPFLSKSMVDTLLNNKGLIKNYLDNEKVILKKELVDLNKSIPDLEKKIKEIDLKQTENLLKQKEALNNRGSYGEAIKLLLVLENNNGFYLQPVIPPPPDDQADQTLNDIIDHFEGIYKRDTTYVFGMTGVIQTVLISEIHAYFKEYSKLKQEEELLKQEEESYYNKLRESKNQIEKLTVLLDQVNKDPFSYLTNHMTYVGSEMFGYKETELSRKNNIYQNVRLMFDAVIGWPSSDNGDNKTIPIMWGGDNTNHRSDWVNANSKTNPLKAEGYAIECDKDIPAGLVFWGNLKRTPLQIGIYKCSEKYYPIQDLERVLGIW